MWLVMERFEFGEKYQSKGKTNHIISFHVFGKSSLSSSISNLESGSLFYFPCASAQYLMVLFLRSANILKSAFLGFDRNIPLAIDPISYKNLFRFRVGPVVVMWYFTIK